MRSPSRARPLPHLECVHKSKCGSGLAREEACPVTTRLIVWAGRQVNKAPHRHQTPASLPPPYAG
ncbi:hypothetical protein FRT60_02105 [Pseudomonas haemolytica]|uniref:Uncharacterized protein n=1 Tax=Pseudomonas haemolytica TaxID=2600065 RepID=A0A646NQU7_9PSED|nr:hypothetical protein [Pseudomonas haemolytica]